MPAKRKRTTKGDEIALYRVTYQYFGAGAGMSGGYTATNKEIRASNWAVQDGLVIFYGSGPIFVVPERSLVSIERLS